MKLSWFVAVALAGMLALFQSPDARAGEIAVVSPHAAAHSARLTEEGVTWTSEFAENDSDGAPTSAVRLDLARPVFAAFDSERSRGVAPLLDGAGAIVAFVIDTDRVPGWQREILVTLRAPLARDRDDIVLAPPLARGDAVQRVEVAGEGDARFEPAAGSGFVRDLRSWSAPGSSEGARRATDERLRGGEVPLGETPIYLDATSSAIAHGLRGRTQTAVERARPGLLTAVAVFVLLIGAMAAAYKWLAGSARVEQAEAILREEYERHGR